MAISVPDYIPAQQSHIRDDHGRFVGDPEAIPLWRFVAYS